MKSKTAELNLRADLNTSDTSLDEADDINLYDDLLEFSNLSPEEQEAEIHRSRIDISQPPPVEIPEPDVANEEQQASNPVEEYSAHAASAPLPQANDAFFFEPPAQVAKEPVKKAVSRPAQTDAFDKESNADFQLAEILRVTGQLADLSTRPDSSSVCADCGSSADSGELFCINCGGSLDEIELAETLSCDDCGAMVVSDEIFCPSCGSAMPDA